MNLEFPRHVCEKIFKRKNLKQILEVGTELFNAGERSDSDIPKRKVAFRNYVHAPKIQIVDLF